MKSEFSRQILEKYPNIKFTKIRRLGTEVFHADRHEEANSRFSHCERV